MHRKTSIHITGVVQGVGFRPFIHNLAHKYNLKGFCLNDSQDAIIKAISLLKEGYILAIKGLGGFHLACDAINQDAAKNCGKERGSQINLCPHGPWY